MPVVTGSRGFAHRCALPWLRNCLLAGLLLLLSGCASYSPEPLQNWPEPGNIQTQTERGVTVTTGILEDEQARRLYGVDLASVGLQAIWLRIENATEHGCWLMVSALDPNYFAPNEAAVLFYPMFAAADEARLTQRARDLAIPLKTSAGAVKRFGFVGGIEPASADNPHTNLSDDPYFTDGLRLVALLSGTTTTSPDAVGFFEWDKSRDPQGK